MGRELVTIRLGVVGAPLGAKGALLATTGSRQSRSYIATISYRRNAERCETVMHIDE